MSPCRVRAPIVSATCGGPLTVTASSNPTSTRIVSPAPNVSPLCGLAYTATLVTVGTRSTLPFTL